MMALALVLAHLPSLSAQVPPAPRFTVQRAPGAIDIDGRLGDPGWTGATQIPLEWEWFPGDNVPAPVATECWMTYDTSNLYVACHAHDPEPSAIRAHFADRDDLNRTVQDDHIALLLDPFNDERRGFQFRVNALGVQMDAFLSTAEGFEDFAWDAIWGSAGRITDDGYVVEIAIPFRSIRFPETNGTQTWGMFLERSYPRSSRHRMRSMPTDRNNTCLLCQANKVTGFEGISPGSNVELYPTLTAGRSEARNPFPTGDLEPVGNGDVLGVDVHPGLDVRWGITPNLSLNATANPDFSQVEADVAQLDVNTRFALYYPEKRPFFLEGADIFQTPIEAVFTRTIADPVGGLKLSGKAGANGLGFFTAYDRQANLLLPANQGSSSGALADSILTTVARYRRDLGRSSYVGALFAGREAFDAYHNRVTGIDAYWQLSRSNSIRIQALGSVTAYPDSFATARGQPTGEFSGSGLSAQFTHSSLNWFANLEYGDLSPEFRADAGFVPRVDQRRVEASGVRQFWGRRGAWFTNIHAGVSGDVTFDYGGTVTDRRGSVFAGYLGPSQLSLSTSLNQNLVRYAGTDHELLSLSSSAQIRPSGGVAVGVATSVGDQVDFANNRKAFRIAVSPSAQVSIGRPITLSVSHAFQRLSYQGMRIYTANLFQMQGFYHLNLRMFVRAIVQFQQVDYNPAAYAALANEQSRSLFTQLLFSYKLNPQTVAFLGYTDTRQGSDTIDLTQQGRTFFMKLGYAIRP
jgi:Domain of unknown function (DUF5916)/Carbohydrate family 9 binding domain-like